jgi:hypothetical protein
MRVAFGLVSLLVVVAIILLMFSFYQAPMIKKGVSARDEARQLAGRDEDNAPVTDAITLDAQDKGGRMEGAVVTSVVPGSAIEKRYGFKNGDVILELGPLTVRDHMNSPEEARDFLLDAYQKSQPVVVLRGWERLTLPLEAPARNAAASAAPARAAPVVAAPEAAPDPSKQTTEQPQPTAPEQTAQQKPAQKKPGGLEGQLDLIRNLPGNNGGE